MSAYLHILLFSISCWKYFPLGLAEKHYVLIIGVNWYQHLSTVNELQKHFFSSVLVSTDRKAQALTELNVVTSLHFGRVHWLKSISKHYPIKSI